MGVLQRDIMDVKGVKLENKRYGIEVYVFSHGDLGGNFVDFLGIMFLVKECEITLIYG
jgi:hypothetical protein